MEKEEILFKNTTKMEDKDVLFFQSFAMKKVNLVASILFAFVFVGIGVGLSFIQFTFGIITIVCGVLGGFVLLPYLMKESIKKQNANKTDERRYLNTFAFYDEYVLITTESAMPNNNEYQEIASQKLFYTDLVQALLYKEYIFLYINGQQAFMINYKGMTQGTICELIDFMKIKEIKIIDKSNK